MAAGKTTSRPSRDGSGIALAPRMPMIVAAFHGMNVDPIAASQ